MEQKVIPPAFSVTCAKCLATLLTTARITDPELGEMERHLRTRHLSIRLSAAPAPGEVLDHYRVKPAPR